MEETVAFVQKHALHGVEIDSVIGLTARATRYRLLKLVECGLVREIGTSPQDPRRRYFRTG